MMRILGEVMLTLSASPALSILAKASIAIAAGLIGAGLARRSRAAVRHALLASAFSILLALPVVSLIATPVPIAVPVAASNGTVSTLFDDVSVPLSGAPAAASFSALPAKSGSSLPPLSTMLLYAWFIGAALFAIPIVSGLLQIRSLRRYGLPWRDGQMIGEDLARGLRRRVEVLLHESLPGPMTSGVLHPAIILPADAQSWNEQDLQRAIVHELAHVRRYDWAIHCLARLACAAYWFHPLVWIAWRRLDLEAERSCDDAVLGSSEATAYADQLVGLAKRLRAQRSPALAMANRSDLSARVGALLDGKQARGPLGALLVTLACIAAAAIVLTVSPLQMVAAPQGTPAVQNIPKWEAVSIKLCTTPPVRRAEGQAGPAPQSDDRIMLNCAPLQSLISGAYIVWAGGKRNAAKISTTNLEGFPDWVNSERYTIEAKAEGNPGLPMMMGPMMQVLLEDRFRLKVHEETREGKVFILSVAKGGPKMKTLQPGSCVPYGSEIPDPTAANRCTYIQQRDGNMGFDAWMNMDALANLLTGGTRNPQSPLDAPIINKTGLTDAYHVQVEYTPATPLPDAPPAASIFTAIQELGLRLEVGKGPHEFLVFDHAERPSGN
jgi:uncharacterized protein (TIGR03435 family)